MRCTSWNEHCITHALQDGITLYIVLFQQSLPELIVQVPALVVNGIVMRFNLFATLFRNFVEEIANLVGISGIEDVPQCPWLLFAFLDPFLRGFITTSFVNGFKSGLLIG